MTREQAINQLTARYLRACTTHNSRRARVCLRVIGRLRGDSIGAWHRAGDPKVTS